MLKTIAKRALKQAIVAFSVSYASVKVLGHVDLHTLAGWEKIAIVFFTPIATSEAAYFWPKILAWAQSSDN